MSKPTTGAGAPISTPSHIQSGFHETEDGYLFSVNPGIHVKTALNSASLILLTAISVLNDTVDDCNNDSIFAALYLLGSVQATINSVLPALE